jgi:hypothetical protein
MESVRDRLLKYAHIENIPSDTPTVGFPLQHYNANPALRDFNMFLRFDIPGMTIDSQDLGYYVKTAKCVLLKCLLEHKVSFAKAAELAGLNMEEFTKVIQTGNKL